MRLRVLGPMEVRCDEGWLPVRAAKQRALLATLLIGAGSAVSVDRLIEELWPAKPPVDPAGQVYLLVSRLRRLFGDDGSAVIQTVSPGYRLTLPRDDTDMGRVGRLSARGLTSLGDGDLDAAVATLTEALALWRGPAFADVQSTMAVEAEAGRLEQDRLAALESQLDAELRLGPHAALAAELQALVDQHPFRERICGMLMLALYRSGRKADALEAYRDIYQRLDVELGIQPGQELRNLHEQVLRSDPALDRSAASRATQPGPMWLPPDLSWLTGRATELQQLLSLADRADGSSAAVVISAIDGMAGIGKTVLAVHAAHRLAGRFPDGQLYIDLQGFTQGADPVSPASALDRLLRSVGVPGEQIPGDLEELAALWRSLLVDRRVLLLLDNAASESQVRPLLPAASGCLVLVTSRRRLGDLDDAVPVSLDVLPLPDAVELFHAAAGPGRLEAELSERVAQAVELCGRLPLAVRLLAGRLRNRPDWRLADVLDRLRYDPGWVTELDTGRRSVAAAFGLSYDHLDVDHRRLFRRLDLHPGSDFDAYAAAALAGVDVRVAERVLEELVDVHLLESRSYGRYAFHDLLRMYAASAARDEDSESERGDALSRLIDHCVHAASAAMDAYSPARKHARPHLTPAPASVPAFTKDRALNWLDRERTNLLALAGRAASTGRSAQVCQLSGILARYLEHGARYTEAAELYERHLLAARAIGDRGEEAKALWLLGRLQYQIKGGPTSLDYLRQALSCSPEADPAARASLLNDIGAVLREMSCFSDARDHLQEAGELYQEDGDLAGAANALCGLAEIAQVLDDVDQALSHGQQAITLAQQAGDRTTEGYTHHTLGSTHLAMAHHETALEELHIALLRYREAGHRAAECVTLALLGKALRGLGRYAESLEHCTAGLSLAQEIRNRNSELEAHQALAETLQACGRTGEAIVHLNQALELAVTLEQPLDQARAHDALGAACHALSDPDPARRHWIQALDVYGRLGVSDAEAVRARLASLDGVSSRPASAVSNVDGEPAADGRGLGDA